MIFYFNIVLAVLLIIAACVIFKFYVDADFLVEKFKKDFLKDLSKVMDKEWRGEVNLTWETKSKCEQAIQDHMNANLDIIIKNYTKVIESYLDEKYNFSLDRVEEKVSSEIATKYVRDNLVEIYKNIDTQAITNAAVMQMANKVFNHGSADNSRETLMLN